MSRKDWRPCHFLRWGRSYGLASCKITGQDWFSKREPLSILLNEDVIGVLWDEIVYSRGVVFTTEPSFGYSVLSFSSLRRQEKN